MFRTQSTIRSISGITLVLAALTSQSCAEAPESGSEEAAVATASQAITTPSGSTVASWDNVRTIAAKNKDAMAVIGAIKTAYDIGKQVWELSHIFDTSVTLLDIQKQIDNIGYSLSWQINQTALAEELGWIRSANISAKTCLQNWDGISPYTCPELALLPNGNRPSVITDMTAALTVLEDPTMAMRAYIASATNGAWTGIVKSRPTQTPGNPSPLVFDWRLVVPTLMGAIDMQLGVAAAADPYFTCDNYWTGKGQIVQQHIDALKALRQKMLDGIQCNITVRNDFPGHYGVATTRLVCADIYTGLSADVLLSQCATGGFQGNGSNMVYYPYNCPGYTDDKQWACQVPGTSGLPDNFDLGTCSMSARFCADPVHTPKDCRSALGDPKTVAAREADMRSQIIQHMPIDELAAMIQSLQSLIDYGCAKPSPLVQGVIAGTQQRYPLDFSIFTFNGTSTLNDINGPVAVGGPVTLSSFALNRYGGQKVGLVAGSDLTMLYGGTVYGDTYLNPSAVLNISSSVTFNGAINTTIPIDFDSAQVNITAASDALSAYAATGTTSPIDSGAGLRLSGTLPKYNVFAVSAEALANARSIELSIPADATAIINVSGTAVTLQNLGFRIGTTPESHILWNLPSALSFDTASINMMGSVLAPRAAAHIKWGAFNGMLVATSISNNYVEFHWKPFRGDLPALAL
jgi:choice-of-anchor A domain-containing protein